jgi:hypothetical protein
MQREVQMKILYETIDGERFDTQAEAESHEQTLNARAEIENALNVLSVTCFDEGGGLNPGEVALYLVKHPEVAEKLAAALDKVHADAVKL